MRNSKSAYCSPKTTFGSYYYLKYKSGSIHRKDKYILKTIETKFEVNEFQETNSMKLDFMKLDFMKLNFIILYFCINSHR